MVRLLVKEQTLPVLITETAHGLPDVHPAVRRVVMALPEQQILMLIFPLPEHPVVTLLTRSLTLIPEPKTATPALSESDDDLYVFSTLMATSAVITVALVPP